MKKILFATAVATLAFCGPVLAADTKPAPRAPAAPAPVVVVAPKPTSFAGIYFGVVGGYAWGTSRVSDTGGISTASFDVSGWLLGGTVGVNWQTDRFVFGIEGDVSGTNITGSTPAFGGATEKTRTFATLRGRAGVVRGPALLYLTGGWAVAKTNITTSLFAGNVTANGATVGAGVEIAASARWSVKAEYLYVALTRSSQVPAPLPIYSDYWRTNVVRVGVNVRL